MISYARTISVCKAILSIISFHFIPGYAIIPYSIKQGEEHSVNNARFSINSVIIIVMAFAALIFFFMLLVVDMSFNPARNDWYNIEGTDVSVRYSSLENSGIYQGKYQNTAVLRIKGDFGYEWGNALEGDKLYLNEFNDSPFGVMTSKLVCVDINTFEKHTLYHDMLICGRCASGEIVCLSDFMMPNNFPKSNALAELYALSSKRIRPLDEGAQVVFIDPVSGKIVYRDHEEDAFGEGFSERWLDRTLEEVMK